MARKIFYSFDFKTDSQRVAKVKNMEVLEAQPLLNANKWEEVKAGGDRAIQAWIDREMSDKSCVVVLIGARTANRRWVDYEIKKAWEAKKGLLGVRIHNLTNLGLQTSAKGASPFRGWTVGSSKQAMDSIVQTYDPAGATSADVLDTIRKNLSTWVETAIATRQGFRG
jgi:hypothetical protein